MSVLSINIVDDNSVAGGVQLPIGRELDVALRANPTTGYTWRLVTDNTGPVSLKSRDFATSTPAPPGSTGAGGMEHFVFETRATGSVVLRFEYRRVGTDQATRIYALTVTVAP